MFRGPKNNIDWRQVMSVLGAILLVSMGHYLAPPSMPPLHSLFQNLYYLPIVLGSIYFGLRGGLLAAALSAMCYLPHIFMWWGINRVFSISQYSELSVFFLVGAVTGFLVDREREEARDLQLTTLELGSAYEDLSSRPHGSRTEQRFSIGQPPASKADEFRTLLASIEGAAETARQQETSVELRHELLGAITKKCRRLKGLLIDLTKIR